MTKPPLVTTYARLPIEHRDALTRIAEDEGLDLSDIIRRAIRFYLATLDEGANTDPQVVGNGAARD